MHALFSRVPAVVWTGILTFVLTVSAGAVWINVAQTIIFSTLAILAFFWLARVTKSVHAVGVNYKLSSTSRHHEATQSGRP
jgi:hypothetical protein